MEATASIKELLSLIFQGFKNVRLAQSFGEDFKLHQSQLAIIQLRLSRWGQAAGFASQTLEDDARSQDVNEAKGNPQGSALKLNCDAIEGVLEKVISVLDKAKNEAQKWQPKDIPSDNETTDDLTPRRFKRLNDKIQKIIITRYHKAADQVEGLKWVLYKKEHCEAVTKQLLELITQLEELVQPQTELEELTKTDLAAIGESLDTLMEVVGDCDPRLTVAAEQLLEDRAELSNITMSAVTNNGIQMGVNRGTLSGLSFGTGNTITNNMK